MTAAPTCDCAAQLHDTFAAQGIDATVSHIPPLVHPGYTLRLLCPHGVRWYAEPTGEQRAAWARDGVA